MMMFIDILQIFKANQFDCLEGNNDGGRRDRSGPPLASLDQYEYIMKEDTFQEAHERRWNCQ